LASAGDVLRGENTMRTRWRITKVVCGLVLLHGLLSNLNAGNGPDQQILFLRFKLTNGVVNLVASTAVAGHLKPTVTAEKPGDLYLELISTNNLPVWTDVVPDPLVRRYEYEDPDHPGQLKVKEVKLDQAEFTVRVPGRKEARQLKIYRLDRPAAQSSAAASRRTKTLLSIIDLHVPESVP
jgi:hypothetical protein